jgi:hypothetical protein
MGKAGTAIDQCAAFQGVAWRDDEASQEHLETSTRVAFAT